MNKKGGNLKSGTTSDVSKRSIAAHKKLNGKIEITLRAPIENGADLSMFYTPGVGAVSSLLGKHPRLAYEYTIKRNTVAIVSDGSAVLGLGNIGPEGALPVMEGKAMIFKRFAGVDAFPIVLNTQDPEMIIATIKAIAPTFGGINLEDISAPRCFDIEARLRDELSIPVMHDDQHGTAIVVLAGLINAFRVVRKTIGKAKIVIVGAGAAGTAVARLLHGYGARNILSVDSKGVLSPGRSDLNRHKHALAELTNSKNFMGNLASAIVGADAVIGVSGPGILRREDIARMNRHPIVFALANPVPEIMPAEAIAGGAAIIATGRSDFQNQINNSLVFPGVFRGALDNRVRRITDGMKLNAALAIAKMVHKPTAQHIVPSIFDPHLVRAVAKSIHE
jgi:malate dehydrogenase (oxaloacetate-decarboxylating)